MEVKTGVVLEEQVHCDLAVVREGLKAIDVGGLDLPLGAAVIVVVPLDADLAEEPRVIAVVVLVAWGCLLYTSRCV